MAAPVTQPRPAPSQWEASAPSYRPRMNPRPMSALHLTADDDRTDADAAPAASRTSRRAILGAVGATLTAALAGCTATGAPEESGRPRTESGPLVDTRTRVEAGSAASHRFSLGTERWVSVAATLTDRPLEVKRDGPGIDVVVMTPAQFERFRTEDAFAHQPGVSMPDVVSGEVAATLAAGEYVLVVDHSAVGPGEPDSQGTPAVVDLTVTATAGRDRATAGLHGATR